MSHDIGRAVLDSGIVHFHGTEWVATASTPNILFGAATTRFFPGDPDVQLIPGGISIGFALQKADKYSGIQSIDYEGGRYTLYFVAERHGDLPGGALYSVSYSLLED